jgi:hypothetical protein
MASEDLIKALSPGIGHQTEEDGTIIQDHAAPPTVFSNLMGHLLDQLSTGYSERSKNEENKESVTILDERFVGCNGKKGESAESEVSMAGSDQNESNSIDDQTVEQGTGWLREEAKGCNENEDGVSLLKTENFKNEVRSWRIAMEEEVQRRILDSMVNWFLREEELVDNENKKREAAESGVSMAGSDQGFKDEDCKLNEAISIDNPNAMEDEVQRRLRDYLVNWFLREEELVDNHMETLLSLGNWHGGKEKKIDNENVGSLAETESFKKREVAEIVEQGTGWEREFSRRIARDAEVQRRLLDSMVNWFLREEELVYT